MYPKKTRRRQTFDRNLAMQASIASTKDFAHTALR
jgi:hypothetical protein